MSRLDLIAHRQQRLMIDDVITTALLMILWVAVIAMLI